MQNEKQEIHTVFPCFPFFCLTKNLSLPALAYLFRASYAHWAKIHNLQEAARTINYLTENGLLRYADLEAKVEDIHSSYDRTGKELITVESRLREVQPLIKNISNYHRLKPVYEAYQRAKDKAAFRSSHEAELVIFEAARSTLLAIQGDAKLPSLKSLRAEHEQLTQEQQRLYEERANLKRQAKQIDTIRANVISYLNLSTEQEIQKAKESLNKSSAAGQRIFFASHAE